VAICFLTGCCGLKLTERVVGVCLFGAFGKTAKIKQLKSAGIDNVRRACGTGTSHPDRTRKDRD